MVFESCPVRLWALSVSIKMAAVKGEKMAFFAAPGTCTNLERRVKMRREEQPEGTA